MSDRELLELAATAAGVPGGWVEQNRTFHLAEHLRGPSDDARASREALGLAHGRIWWDPLTDDGDALRLAVKLRMSVRHEDGEVWVRAKGKPAHRDWACAPTTGGANAGLRRAIVQAAADAIDLAIHAPPPKGQPCAHTDLRTTYPGHDEYEVTCAQCGVTLEHGTVDATSEPQSPRPAPGNTAR